MELKAVYKCEICGNVVEVLDAKGPAISCCGEEMTKLEEQSKDASVEKHVPVINDHQDGVEVIVGTSLHPMTENHQIVFIEVLTKDNKVYRADLAADDKPAAIFPVKKDDILKAREYCNVHDLWKS